MTYYNVKYVIIAPILYHFVFNLSTTIEKLVKIVPFFMQERAFFDEKCPKKAILYVKGCLIANHRFPNGGLVEARHAGESYFILRGGARRMFI